MSAPAATIRDPERYTIGRQRLEEWLADLYAGRFTCHYCGSAVATTKDHIVPRVLYAPGCLRNLQPACEPCNVAKGCRLPTCPCEKCQGALMWWRTTQAPAIPPLLRRMLVSLSASDLATILSWQPG